LRLSGLRVRSRTQGNVSCDEEQCGNEREESRLTDTVHFRKGPFARCRFCRLMITDSARAGFRRHNKRIAGLPRRNGRMMKEKGGEVKKE